MLSPPREAGLATVPYSTTTCASSTNGAITRCRTSAYSTIYNASDCCLAYERWLAMERFALSLEA